MSLIDEYVADGGKVTLVPVGQRGVSKAKIVKAVTASKKSARISPVKQVCSRHTPSKFVNERTPLGRDLMRSQLKAMRRRTRRAP